MLRELWQSQPLYYWAIFAALVVAVVAVFTVARWKIGVEATKLMRRIELVPDTDTYLANLCWTYMRESEALLAHRLGMQRLIREHPERVAALLAQAPRLQIVGDDWAVI